MKKLGIIVSIISLSIYNIEAFEKSKRYEPQAIIDRKAATFLGGCAGTCVGISIGKRTATFIMLYATKYIQADTQLISKHLSKRLSLFIPLSVIPSAITGCMLGDEMHKKYTDQKNKFLE